jgi:hypothetical protein
MSVFVSTTLSVSSSGSYIADRIVHLHEADVVALTALTSCQAFDLDSATAKTALCLVAGYWHRVGADVQEVSTSPPMSLAEAARVPIRKCHAVTFRVYVHVGSASSIGMIFPAEEGQNPFTGIVVIPLSSTRVVYDVGTGEICYRLDAMGQEGTERDSDADLDERALRTARYLIEDTGDELAVLRADRPLPDGRGFRVDPGRRELLEQPDGDPLSPPFPRRPR